MFEEANAAAPVCSFALFIYSGRCGGTSLLIPQVIFIKTRSKNKSGIDVILPKRALKHKRPDETRRCSNCGRCLGSLRRVITPYAGDDLRLPITRRWPLVFPAPLLVPPPPHVLSQLWLPSQTRPSGLRGPESHLTPGR